MTLPVDSGQVDFLLLQDLYQQAKYTLRNRQDGKTEYLIGGKISENREAICAFFSGFGIKMKPVPDEIHINWSGTVVAIIPFPGLYVEFFGPEIEAIVDAALLKKKLN